MKTPQAHGKCHSRGRPDQFWPVDHKTPLLRGSYHLKGNGLAIYWVGQKAHMGSSLQRMEKPKQTLQPTPLTGRGQPWAEPWSSRASQATAHPAAALWGDHVVGPTPDPGSGCSSNFGGKLGWASDKKAKTSGQVPGPEPWGYPHTEATLTLALHMPPLSSCQSTTLAADMPPHPVRRVSAPRAGDQQVRPRPQPTKGPTILPTSVAWWHRYGERLWSLAAL